MAQRLYQQFQKTIAKEVVTLFGGFTVGAVGAVNPIGRVANQGIRSIVRNGIGNYTITFGDPNNNTIDRYAEFLGVTVTPILNGTPAFTTWVLSATDIRVSGTITIQFYGPTSSSVTTLVAAELNTGTQLKFSVTMRNTLNI
jgi:hypothetical protein